MRVAAGKGEEWEGGREGRQTSDGMGRDHYQTLGLPRDATKEQIKTKFRQLARKVTHRSLNPVFLFRAQASCRGDLLGIEDGTLHGSHECVHCVVTPLCVLLELGSDWLHGLGSFCAPLIATSSVFPVKGTPAHEIRPCKAWLSNHCVCSMLQCSPNMLVFPVSYASITPLLGPHPNPNPHYQPTLQIHQHPSQPLIRDLACFYCA